jgi:peptidoglycan/LPS O-acetylase OafA/YrhL
MGVMLFFVHTSLVLMYSLDRTAARGTFLLRNFYLRRAFRIYPLSIAIVVVILAFRIPVASWPWRLSDMSTTTVAANLLLVQNLLYAPSVLGPLWSLPLEIQMYVLLPFLYWMVSRGQRLDLALGIWVLLLGLTFVQPHVTERANVVQYGPCFMSGVLAFCLSKRRAPMLPFWMWMLVLGCVMFAFLTLTARPDAHLMPYTWGLTIVVVSLIPFFGETSSRVIRHVGSTVAKYSYSIYRTHMIALWLAFVWLDLTSLTLRIVVGIGLTSVLSLLAYHLVEAPCMRLGLRFAARATQPPPGVARRADRRPRAMRMCG